MWEYRAALPLNSPELGSVIHDGDTVKILIDLGFDARTEKWIRLAGVGAPELNQPGGTEARVYTATWLMDRAGYSAAAKRHLRWPLRVVTEITNVTEPGERTSFNRIIATIYDISGGPSLNQDLTAFLLRHPEWPHGKAT